MIRSSIPRAVLAVLGSLLAICFWPPESYSDLLSGTAEEVGLRVATESRERQKGFGNFTASLTMTLRNKQGKETQRSLRLKVMEAHEKRRNTDVFDHSYNP